MIKHAAIKQNGIIYVGKRHYNRIAVMIECGLPKPVTGEQGFVTEKGEFVTHEEALKIAVANNQIIKKHGSSSELYSEDPY
ncbi:MAG: hypothetical protein M3367_17580 [Acidobacteriota bacterium]|nr:hypothetical protein [Acidobacteriota bacterium]